ncbi:MAG: hypothetical protein HYU66_02790 [Armatimonadetes bacterium]|nr:hypothetical protein [Armatimonadota bacterium]
MDVAIVALVLIFVVLPAMAFRFVLAVQKLKSESKARASEERVSRLEQEVEELRRLVTDAILEGEEALPRATGQVRSSRSADAS